MKDEMNKEIAAHFKDMHGKPISIGSTLINPDGYENVVNKRDNFCKTNTALL